MSKAKKTSKPKNALGQALEIAEHYADTNPSIRALADMVRTSVSLAKIARSDSGAMLGAWRMGIEGEEGYGVMTTMDMDAVTNVMREVAAIHEVGIATWALITALQAQGETIEI